MGLPETARVGRSDSPLVVRFAHAKRRDIPCLRSWRRAAREIADPRARDAADYAKAAFGKWNLCRRERTVASSLREAEHMIQNNPREEVQILLLAKSAVPGAAMAGLCLFRRTWCNHVVVDLLAVHPRELVSKRERFKGLGSCLLWYVAEFADALKAKRLWLEATQNSAGAYAAIFELSEVEDLVILDQPKYTSFRDSMRRGHGLES